MSYRSKKKDAVGEEKHFTFDHQTGEITAKSSGVIDFPAGMVPEQAPVGTSAAVGAPQPGPVRMTNRMAQEFMFAPQLSTHLSQKPAFREFQGYVADDFIRHKFPDKHGREDLSEKERDSLGWNPFLSRNDRARLQETYGDNFDDEKWQRVFDESKKMHEARGAPANPSYPQYYDEVDELGRMMRNADEKARLERTSSGRGKRSQKMPLVNPENAQAEGQMCTCAEPLLMPSLGSGMGSARLWGGRGRLEEEDGYWSD